MPPCGRQQRNLASANPPYIKTSQTGWRRSTRSWQSLCGGCWRSIRQNAIFGAVWQRKKNTFIGCSDQSPEGEMFLSDRRNKGYGNTKRGLGAGSLKNSFCRGLLWLSFAKNHSDTNKIAGIPKQIPLKKTLFFPCFLKGNCVGCLQKKT